MYCHKHLKKIRKKEMKLGPRPPPKLAIIVWLVFFCQTPLPPNLKWIVFIILHLPLSLNNVSGLSDLTELIGTYFTSWNIVHANWEQIHVCIKATAHLSIYGVTSVCWAFIPGLGGRTSPVIIAMSLNIAQLATTVQFVNCHSSLTGHYQRNLLYGFSSDPGIPGVRSMGLDVTE